jgi:hypothetical protein
VCRDTAGLLSKDITLKLHPAIEGCVVEEIEVVINGSVLRPELT